MKKDILIQDFTTDYNITLIDSQSQRAINWLKINTEEVFCNFGVRWQKFLSDENSDISLQGIQEYASQELAKNGMNFDVVSLDLTDPSAPLFNIKEADNGVG